MPEQLIFLDESAANEHTADQRYGWSPKGFSCHVRFPCKKSRCWSILPAINLDGYMAVDIYQGSYNSARFNEFVQLCVLPQCQAGWSVLVMDNCNIHCSSELQDLCKEAGVELAFLPPYSPDLNPIEQSFHALKK
jgi:hypothetical protein